jgi:hypothetical protein
VMNHFYRRHHEVRRLRRGRQRSPAHAARRSRRPGRDPRQYAPEIPVAVAASPRQRFLAFTGRAEPR